MNLKKWMGFVLIVCLVVWVVGCSSNNNSASNDSGSSKTDSPVETTLSILSFVDEAEFMEAHVKKFEERHPGVKVKVEHVLDDELFTKFQTLLQGGQAPDIFNMFNGYAGQLLTEGVLAPVQLDKMGVSDLAELEAQYIPGALNAYIKDGKLYGIPQQVSAYQAWVNMKIFEEAGIPVPKTWEELIANADKLTKIENGQVVQEAIALPLNFPAAVNLILDTVTRQNGMAMFSEDGKTSNLTQPEVIEVFQMFQDLVHKHKAFFPELNGATTASERTLFGQGKAAILLNAGSWYAGTLESQFPEVWKTAAVAPYPTFEGKPTQTTLYGYAWVVTETSKNKELAWDFLNQMRNDGVFQFESKDAGTFNGAKVVNESEMAKNQKFWIDNWVPALSEGKYEVNLVNKNRIAAIIDKAFSEILLKNADVKTILENAHKEIQPLLNK